MELITVLWIVLAVILFVGELWLPSFFLIWFSAAAGVSALISVFGGSLQIQWIGFLGTSFALLLLSRRFAERISKPQPVKMNVDAYLGENGVVLEKIDPAEDTGMVRVKKETWRAESDGPIEKGEEITVTGVEGVHLAVKKRGEK
ncbi:MAG: NfeD family protein [Euryarchaeota archaeon]|nr:NfeD family protein [Euryarchaeota archaeon]